MRVDVLAVLSVEIAVFRDVTPCSLVKRYQPTTNLSLQRQTVSKAAAFLDCGFCPLKTSDPMLGPWPHFSSGL
jgi:hypothetical protein